MPSQGPKSNLNQDQLKNQIKHLSFQQMTQLLMDLAPNAQGGFGNARISSATTRTVTVTPDKTNPDDFLLLVNAGIATENLPPAADGGRLLFIVNLGTSTAVTPSGADTINGAGTVTLSNVGEFLVLLSDTISDWKPLGRGVGAALADVSGPAASTDRAIAIWNGTTGGVLNDSAVTIDPSGIITPVTPDAQGLGKGFQNWLFAWISNLISDGDMLIGPHGNLLISVGGGTTTFDNNVIPDMDNSRNFGSATNQWASLYARVLQATVGDLTIGSILSDLNLAVGLTGNEYHSDQRGITVFRIYRSSGQTYISADNGTILDMTGSKIKNVLDPTAAQDAATKNYVDGVAAALNPAVAVQAATTAAANTSAYTYSNGVAGVGATLTGLVNTAFAPDGVTFTAVGQRVLVKDDTVAPSGARNGVYYVTQIQTAILPVILTRALDYDQSSDINNTGAIPVVNGTVNTKTSWLLTSSVTTVGTDPLTYTQFSINPSTIVPTTRTINTTTPITGGGDLSADRTIAISDATATVRGVVPTPPNDVTKYFKGDASFGAIANSDLANSMRDRTLTFGWDGSGSVCATGSTQAVTIPFAGTIVGWSIESDGSSPTCTMDVWKIAAGTALPTVSNTIMGTKPALSTGNVKQSSTLTAWTTAVALNDIFIANLDAVTVGTKITLSIVVRV